MEKKENKAGKIALGIVLFIASSVLGAGIMYGMIMLFPNIAPTINNITRTEKEVTVNELGISDAVDKIYDAVVVVETFKSDKLAASGTGFVFKKDDKKAYIMTNHHVIEGGDKIKVIFTNGDEVETEVLGSDAYTDIAILALEAKDDMTVAELGSSVDAKVGDTTFAIGAPLADVYSWSVTRGIVSGKDRLVEVSTSNYSNNDWIMRVLQTDTAINSGNSGGPLCNSNGQVIGITSMKLVSSGVEGMGFAIPIEDATEYADLIIKGEKLSRPYMGISMDTIDNRVSLYFNYGITVSDKLDYGVVLTSVSKGSPAAKAGLQKGDVVVELGGEKIKSVAEFRYNLYTHEVGEEITVKYFRNDELKEAKVKLAASD